MFSGSRCKSGCEMFCENLLCAVKRVLSGGGGVRATCAALRMPLILTCGMCPNKGSNFTETFSSKFD